MALFGHKKRTEEVKPAPKPMVNPDDIWGTPKKTTVVIKESKYDDPAPEDVSVDSIDPETIRRKMELLEKELEEQKNKPVEDYAGYDNVAQSEVDVAQDKFEEKYEAEHKRYLETHVQDIDSANSSDVDRKITEMVDETERRAEAVRAQNYGIEQVGQDEVAKGLAELHDPKDVTKDKDFKNIEAVSDEAMSGVEDYIRNTLDTRVPVEDEDEIESVPDDYVEKKTEEFMKQYGDRKK